MEEVQLHFGHMFHPLLGLKMSVSRGSARNRCMKPGSAGLEVKRGFKNSMKPCHLPKQRCVAVVEKNLYVINQHVLVERHTSAATALQLKQISAQD